MSAPEPDLFDPRPSPALSQSPPSAWSGPGGTGRRRDAPAPSLRLYAVYVLILLAVPTLGVSALVGLLAVRGRGDGLASQAASHFVYQQRTLAAGVGVAVLGALLLIVNIGVFVLFLLAVWTLIRGAVGVLKLKSGQAVSNPRTWLF